MADSTRKLSEMPSLATFDNTNDRLIIGDSSNSLWLSQATIPAVVQSGLSSSTTDNLPEGANAYFTDTRARDAVKYRLSEHTTSVSGITATDNFTMYRIDTTSWDLTLALPSASTVGAGFQIAVVNKTWSNSITINRDGSDTIVDQTSMVLTGVWEAIVASSDGTSRWEVVGEYKGTDYTITTDIDWLTEETSLSDTDEFIKYNGTTNVKIQASEIKGYMDTTNFEMTAGEYLLPGVCVRPGITTTTSTETVTVNRSYWLSTYLDSFSHTLNTAAVWSDNYRYTLLTWQFQWRTPPSTWSIYIKARIKENDITLYTSTNQVQIDDNSTTLATFNFSSAHLVPWTSYDVEIYINSWSYLFRGVTWNVDHTYTRWYNGDVSKIYVATSELYSIEPLLSNIVGITTEAIEQDSTWLVSIAWATSIGSWLILWATQYLSLDWSIATSWNVKIWKAISATKINYVQPL